MIYAAVIMCVLGSARVEVMGERVVLGDVARVKGALASVDLGPAPQPGHSRTLTRQQIRSRLRQAMVNATGVRLPNRVRLVRPRQVVSEPELNVLLLGALKRVLPPGATVDDISVTGGLVLAPGAVQVEVNPPRNVRTGRTSLRAIVKSASGRARAVSFTAQLHLKRTQPVVARGQNVQVIARTGGVTVRMSAVVQQSGRAGEMIAILPVGGRKVVQARVIDARNVEIDL